MTTRCYAPQYLRKLVLEMYWDGEQNPSVRVPYGDFFGIGHATCRHYVSLPMNMVSGERRGPKGPFSASNNCYLPMPFGNAARIQLINESEEPIANLFYMIDYELYDDPAPGDLGRFHAAWNIENPCRKVVHPSDIENPAPWDLPGKNLTGAENYVILDAEGAGHYVGCVLNIDNFDASNQVFTWPGEGDDMIFIDGEPLPRLRGTGTEDYFNTAYAPTQDYHAPYHGLILYQGTDDWRWRGKNTLYRYHIEDPVYFDKSIRVTIEHGHANKLTLDYSSTAYWYQTEPHKPFEPLLPVARRLPRL